MSLSIGAKIRFNRDWSSDPVVPEGTITPIIGEGTEVYQLHVGGKNRNVKKHLQGILYVEVVDTDGDGFDDFSEYFPYNASYTQTKEELDAYELRPSDEPTSGDIIRLLQDFTASAKSFTGGDYYVMVNVDASNGRFMIKNQGGGNTYTHIYFADRATDWEIVKPANTSNTSDTDSDGVADDTDYFPDNPNYTQTKSELDAYVISPTAPRNEGAIVRILQGASIQSQPSGSPKDVTAGQYFIITKVGNQWTRFEIEGAVHQVWNTSRGTVWDIVEADALPPGIDSNSILFQVGQAVQSVSIQSYTTENLPSNPTTGTIAFDTVLSIPVYFANGAWRKISDNSSVT